MGRKSIFAKKRKQAYPERKVLLACMPSAKGCGGQSPTWRFDLSPLLLYGIIVQFLQTFRRTQWSRGWMKVRRKGIKRSHRHAKSANVPNSHYLEHLARHPSEIPLYRRNWTVRLLAATEEGTAEKNKRQQCNLPPLYFFKLLQIIYPSLSRFGIRPNCETYANYGTYTHYQCKSFHMTNIPRKRLKFL